MSQIIFRYCLITIPQCTALQHTIQRIRRNKDISTEPQTFADIVIPSNLQTLLQTKNFSSTIIMIIVVDY